MDKKFLEVSLLAGFVYFTQGALGITGVALPIYMRDLGWTISEIATISSIVAFPWVLKIVYGLLSDCIPIFSYRRKSYLILFAILGSLGWASLGLLSSSKASIMACLVLANLGIAAVDVITDGVIVENSEKGRSHIFQSIAWGTRSVGAILSGFTGGWLAARWNPQSIFLLASVLPLTIIIWASLLEEEKHPKSEFHSVLEPLKGCLKFFLLPHLRWFVLFIFISQVAATFGMPFFFYMKETLEFDETFLGSLMSLGWFGAVLASFVYSFWSKKAKAETILKFAVGFSIINILSTVFIRSEQTALILIFLGGVLGVLTLLPLMSVAAILTHGTGIEGALFAILMSIYNICVIALGYLGGQLYPVVGLYPLIYGSAALTLMGFIIIPKLELSRFDQR